jgi:hypothetical protein
MKKEIIPPNNEIQNKIFLKIQILPRLVHNTLL